MTLYICVVLYLISVVLAYLLFKLDFEKANIGPWTVGARTFSISLALIPAVGFITALLATVLHYKNDEKASW